jgi:hypothetical protein
MLHGPSLFLALAAFLCTTARIRGNQQVKVFSRLMHFHHFVEPQGTVAHEGVAPKLQVYMGLNMQFPLGH